MGFALSCSLRSRRTGEARIPSGYARGYAPRNTPERTLGSAQTHRASLGKSLVCDDRAKARCGDSPRSPVGAERAPFGGSAPPRARASPCQGCCKGSFGATRSYAPCSLRRNILSVVASLLPQGCSFVAHCLDCLARTYDV